MTQLNPFFASRFCRGICSQEQKKKEITLKITTSLPSWPLNPGEIGCWHNNRRRAEQLK